jgi:hypothetical protein
MLAISDSPPRAFAALSVSRTAVPLISATEAS